MVEYFRNIFLSPDDIINDYWHWYEKVGKYTQRGLINGIYFTLEYVSEQQISFYCSTQIGITVSVSTCSA